MRGSGTFLAAVALTGALYGCRDECESIPPSFQLDIHSMAGAGSIEVVLMLGTDEYVRTFDVTGKLDDGETSLAVELPAMSADFQIDVAVTAFSGQAAEGGVLGVGSGRFTGSPNGCNRFDLELAATPGETCVPVCTRPDCALACIAGCASCNLDCAGATTICSTSCNDGTACSVACGNTPECVSLCTGGSTCEIDCEDTGECKARCQGSSSCLLRCGNAAECRFLNCPGGQEVTCADGSIACNHACP